MEEQPALDRIEQLVAEEHSLWRAESDGGLDDAGHQRLAVIRRELDLAYEALRRRRAGELYEPPADSDVPDPLNELDGPDPEPPHAEHGLHSVDSSREDPSPNVP